MAQQDVKVGQLINNDSLKRDAIHIAVIPVKAGVTLNPGEKVIIDSDGEAMPCKAKTPVGVIDPFLQHKVGLGDQCWLFMFPETVGNLRHDWDHDAFPQPTTEADTSNDRYDWGECSGC